MNEALICALVERFDGPDVKAIVLLGSYARGDAGPHSDIDLARFTSAQNVHRAEPQSHLIDGCLVVVTDIAPTGSAEWFSAPEVASNTILGLRSARALLDRKETFARIQAQAQAFVWDASMQQKANLWASREMVGWIEEVRKGLEGLRRNDVGRLLNARHGCSWGMSRVAQVQRGILLSGDNAFYDEVAETVGWDSEWVQLRRVAFGIAERDEIAPSLQEQVLAGLRLYALTAEMLASVLRPEDEPLVDETVALIRRFLGDAPA